MGMRPYWAEYANHMLRLYVKTWADDVIQFRTAIDKTNWIACRSVFEKLPTREKDIITHVYRHPCGHMEEGVASYVADHPTETRDSIWAVICGVSRDVARARELI